MLQRLPGDHPPIPPTTPVPVVTVPAIEMQGVVAGYPGGPPVLEVDDLAFEAGTITSVVGPNGCGKSTLLSVLAGLLAPRQGTVRCGQARPERRDIAVVFQSSPSDATLPLTVTEVVGMGRYPSLGLWRRFSVWDRRAVTQAMADLEVSDLAERQLAELSGGQRQRVLVARAIAQRSPILLLDEPTTGMDRRSRERILEVLATHRDRGGTVVVATHDLDDAARSDRVVVLSRWVLADGPPGEVLTDVALSEAYLGRTDAGRGPA